MYTHELVLQASDPDKDGNRTLSFFGKSNITGKMVEKFNVRGTREEFENLMKRMEKVLR